MGVGVREKQKGSGEWWVFINHQGKRKAKKVGNDQAAARKVAEKIKAKLVLGDLKIEKPQNGCPLFEKYALMWLSLDHEWKPSTARSYRDNLINDIFPEFGKHRLDEIRRKDLKLFFDYLLSSGLARSTVALIKAPRPGWCRCGGFRTNRGQPAFGS